MNRRAFVSALAGGVAAALVYRAAPRHYVRNGIPTSLQGIPRCGWYKPCDGCQDCAVYESVFFHEVHAEESLKRGDTFDIDGHFWLILEPPTMRPDGSETMTYKSLVSGTALQAVSPNRDQDLPWTLPPDDAEGSRT